MWNHLGPVIFEKVHLVIIHEVFEVKWVGLQILVQLSL